MKKSIYVPLAVVFMLLFCCSCHDEPTAVQNNLSGDQGVTDLAMGKPPVNGQLKCTLKLTKPDGQSPTWPVELPGPSAPLLIHYEVSGPNPITHATIHIVYDEDKDGVWSAFVSERMRIINLQFDGTQTSVKGDIPWNGEVNLEMSEGGYIFDQYITENPDLYLFPFAAGDDRNSVNNWGPSYEFGQIPPEARAYISPLYTKPEFHVRDITIVPTPRKGKYVADLAANVTCKLTDGSLAIGFYGHGKWVEVGAGGVEGVPLNSSFFDNYETEDGDGIGTASGLSVGPGKYRFYVTMLWSKNKSYRPSVPTVYGEVEVR
jgi:hypothetical protein